VKKILLSIGIAILLIVISFSFTSSRASGLLSGNDFISKYENTPNSVLVDVRTPLEYDASHIAGALNIDYENSNFESEISKLDKSKVYFVYCRSGNRSSKSVILMKKIGINNIYDLQGGIISAPELLK